MSVLFQESNVVSDQLGSKLLKIKTFAISLQPNNNNNNNNRVLASVCLNVSLTCALIHIQVQLESRAPPYTGLTELSLTYTLFNDDETGCE